MKKGTVEIAQLSIKGNRAEFGCKISADKTIFVGR
jgi:hypothetical protein